MAYAEGYNNGHMTFKDGAFKHNPVEVNGEVSIKSIPEKVIKDNHIKVGEVTPFSGLRVTE